MKVVHQWLQEYVGPSIPDAKALEELFMFHAFEVEGIEQVSGHDVIDVKILPDRASYCLSHRGIAREIASITGTPLVHDPLQDEARLPLFDAISVDIHDEHACTRFGAALISGIHVTESPAWLKERLQALGQRPINNIVDATNYVMYALGQPLHAYDAEKFPQKEGKWQFEVRFAKAEETVSLIAEGGKTGDRVVTLQGNELLIVDKSSNTPIGLAGVKGGAYAGVDAATTKIIVEAAHFDPILTRKTARRLGIVIDASKRFENDPSQELIPHALREVVALIEQIAGGSCDGSIDAIKTPVHAKTVQVDPSNVNALLGLELSEETIMGILKQTGIAVVQDKGVLMCTGPFERNDLNIEEDFIEEVGRIYGYDHIVSRIPEAVPLSEINARHFYSEKVREVLTGLGWSEVITSSFNNKDEVKLQNALASDKSFMRSSLRKNIAEVLEKNAPLSDLLGTKDTRVFEIGTVFRKEEEGIGEHVSLCLGVRTKAQGYVPQDDKLIATIIETLQESLGTSCAFAVEKGIAECNWSAVYAELPQPEHYEPVAIAEEIVYKQFSLYPSMSRDIALWVTEGTSVEEVEAVLNAHAGPLRVRTTLFDEFTKEGRTSFGFRLVFQAYDKTLTDLEVNEVMEEVYAALQAKGWETR